MAGAAPKTGRSHTSQQFHHNIGRLPIIHDRPRRLVQEKINLQFIEKQDRHRENRPPGFPVVENVTQDDVSTASKVMCFNGSSNGGPDFGIGELVEEFSNLSSYTPPPTPAAASCTEIPSENAGAAFALSDSSNAANAFPKTFAAPLLKSLGDQLRPTLSSSVPVFSSASTNFVGVVQLSSSAPVPPLLDSLDGSHSSFPVSGCDSFTPTGSSLPSTCDGSVVTSDTSTNPPRAVRRFQYWCRVLQTIQCKVRVILRSWARKFECEVNTCRSYDHTIAESLRFHSISNCERRRNPVCRFCYERYVLMCLDSRQPIPSQFERGMWHGHNMKERGLVTCPHLWAFTCSHCGATKQHAHTDDYCPLKRRNPTCCRSSQN